MKRLPKEEFLIRDLGRNLGIYYKDGTLELVEMEERCLEKSEKEEEIANSWRTFTKAVSIEARKSKKRQQSHMPKKYWAFLTEMQEGFVK